MLPPDPAAHTLVFAVALFAGVLSGLLGVGGGLIIVPLLLTLPAMALGHPLMAMGLITGLSAFQGVVAGVSATRKFLQAGLVVVAWLPVLASINLLGATLGGVVSRTLPDVVLTALLAAVLVVALAMVWRQPTPQHPTTDADTPLPPHPPWHVTAAAVGVSLLAGALGVGGAFLINPQLWILGRLPLKRAIATGGVLMTFTSLGSLTGKASTGLVPWQYALTAALGSALGGYLGARWLKHWPDLALKRLKLAVYIVSLGLTVVKLV